MKTTNERFDENWQLDKPDELTSINENIKTFIQQEKSLLLDQAIEELEKMRMYYAIMSNVKSFEKVDAFAEAISKLKELKKEV